MRIWVVVCLFAATAFGQDDWQRLVLEGAKAQSAGDLSATRDAYVSAVHLLETSPPTMKLAASYNVLANVTRELGDFAGSVRSYRRALAIIESLEGKQNAYYAIILANLGAALTEKGEHASAEKLLRESLSIDLALPVVPQIHVATARTSLAEVLVRMHRLNEAEPLLEQALATFRANPDAQDKLCIALNNMADLRQRQGRMPEALKLFADGVLIAEGIGPDHPRTIRPLNNLAGAYMTMRQPQSAAPLYERALAIAEVRFGLEHPLYNQILLNYSNCVKAIGDKSRARTIRARAERMLDAYSVRSGSGMTVDVSAFH